jgi:hypothetical protein
VLVVSPAPISEAAELGGTFVGGAAKSRALGPLLRDVAARLGTGFLDAGEHVEVSPVDGVHLEPDAHRALAAAIGAAVAG